MSNFGNTMRALKAAAAEAVVDGLTNMFEALRQDLSKKEFEQEECEALDYEDVVRYLASDKSKYPSAVKGAALRQQAGATWLVSVIFLDKNNEPVGGKRVKTEAIGSELQDSFGQNNMVVFE